MSWKKRFKSWTWLLEWMAESLHPGKWPNGFSTSWESSICERKVTQPWESNPGPTPIRGELATLIMSVGLKKRFSNLENKNLNGLWKWFPGKKWNFKHNQRMQFSKTGSKQCLIFPFERYNYRSKHVIMKKKISNKQINAMVSKMNCHWNCNYTFSLHIVHFHYTLYLFIAHCTFSLHIAHFHYTLYPFLAHFVLLLFLLRHADRGAATF